MMILMMYHYNSLKWRNEIYRILPRLLSPYPILIYIINKKADVNFYVDASMLFLAMRSKTRPPQTPYR